MFALFLSQISLVTFLIGNSPKLFGLDVVALWYETSFYHGPGGNTSCDQVTTSNIITRNEPEHGASSCPKGRTYTPDHDEPTISQVAPPLSEGTNGVYTCPTILKLKVRII